MRFTIKSDYALRAMVELAKRQNGHAELTLTREIAGATGIPNNFLAQILRDLRRAGLVEAARGPKGGIRLEKAAEEISMKDIIEASEGAIAFYCCLVKDGVCDLQGNCSVADAWQGMQDSVIARMSEITLEELAVNQSVYSSAGA